MGGAGMCPPPWGWDSPWGCPAVLLKSQLKCLCLPFSITFSLAADKANQTILPPSGSKPNFGHKFISVVKPG